MKFYKELSSYNAFTLSDATKIIGGLPATKKYLAEMVKAGYVKKIRNNLYTCYDFALNSDCANRFQIASSINENSYISYHSAFELYGFYGQTFYEIQVSSRKRFSPFEYDGYSYECFPNHIDIQIDTIQGAKVTSIERTIVDSINMLGKVMDIEELVKCIDLIHLVNEIKLLGVLETYHKEILYRKVGYILSHYKNEFRLSDAFFNVCLTKGVPSNKGCLVINDKRNLKFNSKWGLYVYPNLEEITSKGGNLDV
jgi:predicted transcriptional regulator of viral defense system